MKRIFISKLKNELEKFDFNSGSALVKLINDAELEGYELSPREISLLYRLISCLDSYESNLNNASI